jgi:hypothetical protein
VVRPAVHTLSRLGPQRGAYRPSSIIMTSDKNLPKEGVHSGPSVRIRARGGNGGGIVLSAFAATKITKSRGVCFERAAGD